MRGGASPGRQRPLLSRISIRLLAFNVLLVFLPAAGFLYLDTYEAQLLERQERSMVQQARLLSAALSENGELSEEAAGRLLENLQRRTEARLRIVDRDGRLLADSSRIGPKLEPDAATPRLESETRASWLYRAGALLVRLVPGGLTRPQPAGEGPEFYATSKVLAGGEVRAALAGRYGAATRVSPGQRSITLYSAVPVRSSGEVVGAVLVSQSTFRLLDALYDVRLGIFKVFLLSVGAAVVLTLLVSTTIARPIKRLRDQATEILDRRGRLKGHFTGSTKRDEIGDLARALEELTQRLERHLRFIESFASDVSHEIKNPLASIRSATELLRDVDAPEERRKFLRIVEHEVARMERLLTELREITMIDARFEQETREPVDLAALVAQVVEGFRLRHRDRLQVDYRRPEGPAPVVASPERLGQVVENLLDNAASFSPDGGTLEVTLDTNHARHRLRVADRGPGIAPEHLEQIFERFFSYRPGEDGDRDHTGLGLAIVKTLVEGYGGTVRAENREGGGAVLEVTLPSREA